jgi:RNA polymerase sigma factor (sigma-70 family)
MNYDLIKKEITGSYLVSGRSLGRKVTLLLFDKINISDLPLPIRMHNGLRSKCRIDRLSDLLDTSREELLNIPKLGDKSINDTINCIIEYFEPRHFSSLNLGLNTELKRNINDSQSTVLKQERSHQHNINIKTDYEDDIITAVKKSKYFSGFNHSVIIERNIFKLIRLRMLPFPVRLFSVLAHTNCNNLADLLNTDKDDFLSIKGCGSITYLQSKNIILKIIMNFKLYYLNDNLTNVRFSNSPFSLCVNGQRIRDILDKLEVQCNELVILNDIGNLTIPSRILDNPLNDYIFKDLIEELDILFERLNERETDILYLIDNYFSMVKSRDLYICQMRYSGNNITLEEIGERLGLTRERIRQILKRVIDNIQLSLSDETKKKARDKFLNIVRKDYTPIGRYDLALSMYRFDFEFYQGILSEIFPEIPFENKLYKSLYQHFKKNDEIGSLYRRLNNTDIGNYNTSINELEDNLLGRNRESKIILQLYKIIFSADEYEFRKLDNKYYV